MAIWEKGDMRWLSAISQDRSVQLRRVWVIHTAPAAFIWDKGLPSIFSQNGVLRLCHLTFSCLSLMQVGKMFLAQPVWKAAVRSEPGFSLFPRRWHRWHSWDGRTNKVSPLIWVFDLPIFRLTKAGRKGSVHPSSLLLLRRGEGSVWEHLCLARQGVC